MLYVQVGGVLFAKSLAAPLVDLALVASIPEAGADLVDESVAAAVRLVVQVQLQALKHRGLFRLEHRGPRHSDGRDAHVPQALRIALTLDHNCVPGVCKLRDAPFAVEANLAGAASAPAEILVGVPLAVGGFFSGCVVVGNVQPFGAIVSVFPSFEAAGFGQPFFWKVLCKGVLCKTEIFEDCGLFLFSGFRCLGGNAVFFQNLLVCLFGVHAMELSPKGHEVAAPILCEAVPLAGLEIDREAVVSVLMERAQTCQFVPGEFVFLNHGGVLGAVIHHLIKIYLSCRHAASTAILS